MSSHKRRHDPSTLPGFSPNVTSISNEQAKSSTDRLRTTLSTILPLLDAFNHRHRNQHRTSPWWSTFGIFRRSLKRLDCFLNRQHPGQKRSGADKASPWFVWLNMFILPGAFVAFSQLTADNQHAPLGLFLLVVLSQVHASLASCLQQEQYQGPPEGIVQTRQDKTPSHLVTSNTEATDKGMAISRQAIVGAGNASPRRVTSVQTEQKSNDKKTVTGSRDTRFGHRDEYPNKTMKDKKKKKKKKKKQKDDALSSLFGSLE